MNNEQINKALHDVIRPDDCWHIPYQEEYFNTEYQEDDTRTRCRCGKHGYMPNPDYFSKEGFWDAWEWFNEHHTLTDLVVWLYRADKHEGSIVDYKTFAKHLYDFLVTEGIIKG